MAGAGDVMKLVLELNQQELNNLQTPIIVEMYDKIKESGSKRRAYLKEFNEKERKKISAWYTLAYRWYLKTGTPQRFVFRSVESVNFVKRVVNFFAQL